MLDRFRDLIVLASVPDAIATGLLDTPPDRVEALTGQAERYGLAALTRAADIVSTGLDQMRGATSPRLLLELMCAQVLLPAAATDERSVLARLERLEAGAAAVGGQRPSAAGAGNAHIERTEVTPAPQPSPPRVERPQPTAASPSSTPPAQPASAAPAASPPTAAQPPAAAAAAAATPAHEAGSRPQPPASAPRQSPPSAPPAPPAPAPTAAAGSSGRGSVTTETLVQAWPHVLDAVKAEGRVAAIVIGNASVVSLDEAVLTLRFPRQGDVKGFANSRYEELLKQVINTMFGINVVVRAVAGGDTPPPAGRSGPAPAPPAAPPAAPRESPAPRPAPAESAMPPVSYPQAPSAPDTGSAGGAGGTQGPFGKTAFPSADLPPLPPPPSPDDEEDFDLEDEDMSDSLPHDLSGMALVQRELGGQVIAEYTD
jgi:DNA polymerase-3 subunit gamma/tau